MSKFNFEFANLLGTVYRKGNLMFSADNRCLLSPVGNRVTVFNLKTNRVQTHPFESEYNISCMTLSPDNSLLLAVNEKGTAYVYSLRGDSLLSRYDLHRPVHAVSFSPDGGKILFCKEDTVLLFDAPSSKRCYNSLNLIRTFSCGIQDKVTCIDWSSDSRAFIVGCDDSVSRIFAVKAFQNLRTMSIGGHHQPIVACFLMKDSLDALTVCRRGKVRYWKCSISLQELKPFVKNKETIEDENSTCELNEPINDQKEEYIKYNCRFSHNYKEALEGQRTFLTACDFCKNTNMLLGAFNNGSFFLHEMPDFVMIHSLSISDHAISSAVFNPIGDWVALGCTDMGQLLVWEWQSETYIYKQQAHFNSINVLSFSPDGLHLATGGDDGKIKLWSLLDGSCFTTFDHHTASVTGITFKSTGFVVISCSLDGTVRAFDLRRYRNFRTFTSPRPVQFSCLAIDKSGDIISAGGFSDFGIFLWSLKTGHLLDVLTGHEAPISGLCFSPVDSFLLSSCSWDKTLRLWNVMEMKSPSESLNVLSDALCVMYNPNGKEVCVSTLGAKLLFFEASSGIQTGTIDGNMDLGYARKESDKVTARKLAAGRAFRSVCYTTDGDHIIAAGKSVYVCIYNVKCRILVKRFEITCNRSLDGIVEFLNKRKMTQWGSLSTVDVDDNSNMKPISLPGTKSLDYSSRNYRPEVEVSCVQFCPTGRTWAACSTEGVLIFSLDSHFMFTPFDLTSSVTPFSARKDLSEAKYHSALVKALQINDKTFITEIFESIPYSEIQVIVSMMMPSYVEHLLVYIANRLADTTHIHFYVLWIQAILLIHGHKIRAASGQLMSTFCEIEKHLTTKYATLSKVSETSKYTVEYIKHSNSLSRRFDTASESNENNILSDVSISDHDASDEESLTSKKVKVVRMTAESVDSQ